MIAVLEVVGALLFLYIITGLGLSFLEQQAERNIEERRRKHKREQWPS